jgi:ribonuclease PH
VYTEVHKNLSTANDNEDAPDIESCKRSIVANRKPTPPMTTTPQKNIARSGNRTALSLRPITIERGYIKHAPGSVLISYGDTKVLVTATIEDRVPKHIYGKDQHGWLTAEYSLLPGATHTRNQRDRLKVSGRTMEIQRLIGRSLRACVDLTRLGQRTITIDADVIQADGGTRVAAITGSYIALMDALYHIQAIEQKNNPKLVLWPLPIKSAIAAVSVGIVNGEILLDLDYNEDSTAEVDANIVMNAEGEFIEVQATSEDKPFSRKAMDELIDAAEGGIRQLLELQQQALRGELQGVTTLTVS